MNNEKRIRYIERDYLFNRMRSNTEYITDEQINDCLDEHQYDDLTFIFTMAKSGFTTKVYDNVMEQHIGIDELSAFGYDFYIKQVEDISVEKAVCDKAQIHINKIRDMLTSWDKERKESNYAKAQ